MLVGRYMNVYGNLKKKMRMGMKKKMIFDRLLLRAMTVRVTRLSILFFEKSYCVMNSYLESENSLLLAVVTAERNLAGRSFCVNI